MAMRSSGKGSGGGTGSKNVVKSPVKNGQVAKSMREKGVAQIGSALGNHATAKGAKLNRAVESIRGAPQPRGGPGGVPLGNALAMNVGKGGPGAGRTVHATGGQGQRGPVAGGPKPAGRDILGAFGSESPIVGSRR